MDVVIFSLLAVVVVVSVGGVVSSSSISSSSSCGWSSKSRSEVVRVGVDVQRIILAKAMLVAEIRAIVVGVISAQAMLIV